MPLHIIRNNIVNMECDAIVNTANPYPQIGAGTDSAVYAAAGEKRLLAARQKIGEIAPGMAAVTSGYALKARYIIHTVGPVWEGGENGEEKILRSCYRTSLRIAEAKRCKSVAFPLISSGSYGYPKDAALKTAVEEIRSYLEHSNITVYLVVFGKEAYELSGKYSDAVEVFIDEHYVKAQMEKEYSGQATTVLLRGNERRRKDNLRADRKDDGRRWDKRQADQAAAPGRESPQPDRAADSGKMDDLQVDLAAESDRLDYLETGAIAESVRWDNLETGAIAESVRWDNLETDAVDKSERRDNQQAEIEAEIEEDSAYDLVPPYLDMSEYMSAPQSSTPGFGMPQPAMPKSAAPETATSGSAPRPAAKSSLGFSFRPAASASKKKKKLEDSDIVLAETFSETLLRLIDEKEMTDVEVYKRANIDRKLFSKIRSRRDYQPGKKTALALAVALRLDLDQTKDLLSRAGYAISPSSKFDLIVEFFIVNEVYDIDTINIALFDHQEQTLG